MPPYILVIEDERTWQNIFQDILIQMGYRVAIAMDDDQANSSLATNRYDLLLVDACLDEPGFNLKRQQFFSSLHQRYPSIPVVATTGRPLTPPEMWTLSQIGVFDFIYKLDVQLPNFRRSIQNALQKSISPQQQLNIQPSTPVFHYDTFISYSHHDKDWVHSQLLLRLENAGVRVCIDFRDFEPGAPSLTEMERAVLQSHKTLLVLTPAYLVSQWTEFENLLVQALDPAARQRRLLPLLLKSCEIPLRLKFLVYLDFTDLNSIDAQIDRLVAAIKSDASA